MKWSSGAVFHCVACNLSITINAWQLCPLDSDAGQDDITEADGLRNSTRSCISITVINNKNYLISPAVKVSAVVVSIADPAVLRALTVMV